MSRERDFVPVGYERIRLKQNMAKRFRRSIRWAGVKGAGEAGAIPVGPLFVQALEDALGAGDLGFEILEISLNANRLWEIVSGK